VLALDLMIDHRYRVEELLGRGGMAEVYRAVDTECGQAVAVKLLRDVEATDVHRFGVEVAALARLDHPGVIKLFGSGSHEGAPYLVLELVEGPTLADEVSDGPLGVDRSTGVARQLADALAHAHRLTIVHRDVKPANVLFDTESRARLTDFGTALLADVSGVTAAGMVIGTAPYLAPEQVEGRHVGAAADIYALGLVVLECLTGTRCYPGSRVEAAIARLHRPPAIPTSLPGWLRTVLTRMTARDPARRPSAEAVADAFDRRSAPPVVVATGALTTPRATSFVTVVPTAPLTLNRTRTMPAVPAEARGPRRSPVARRRSRLAAVAAVSVALAVPAWRFASGDPQSADAPTALDPAPAASNPAPAAVPSTLPAPDVDQQRNADEQTDGHDNGGQGEDNGGGGNTGPGKGGGKGGSGSN
jgi:eukaryotic-like serine/threonine-protein kinase